MPISIDFNNYFTDADGDPLTCEVSNMPPGLTLNGCVLSGTISVIGSRDYDVRALDNK